MMEFGKAGKAGKAKGGFKRGSTPDPLAEVEYTGDLAADCDAEFTALAAGFRQRRDAEAQRFRAATDSEYWFAVCFKDRASKDAFLKAIKATRLGDKYIDGHALAQLLGVNLDG